MKNVIEKVFGKKESVDARLEALRVEHANRISELRRERAESTSAEKMAHNEIVSELKTKHKEELLDIRVLQERYLFEQEKKATMKVVTLEAETKALRTLIDNVAAAAKCDIRDAVHEQINKDVKALTSLSEQVSEYKARVEEVNKRLAVAETYNARLVVENEKLLAKIVELADKQPVIVPPAVLPNIPAPVIMPISTTTNTTNNVAEK